MIDLWEVVNDGVMGDLSQGTITISKSGTLIFRGNLSLENNGGFSSFRSSQYAMDLSNAAGITLRVRGDGRTYQFRLTTDARVRDRRVAFMAPFKTKRGEWIEVQVPFTSFAGTWRGESVRSAVLNAALEFLTQSAYLK
ncbi:MAG: CIA30 family protein [Terrimicrobiaceae bacterium]